VAIGSGVEVDECGSTGKRLVFLTECLAKLAERRVVQVWRGDPVEEGSYDHPTISF
jgi:hypothetical protein